MKLPPRWDGPTGTVVLVDKPKGIPSSHGLFSDRSLMDSDEDMVHFDWEKHPAVKKMSNSKSSFDPSVWSFDMADDSEKRRSPLSEESSSSAAVMKDRSCKEPMMNKKDHFHISLDKLDIPKMDADLDGISLFSNPEEYHIRTTDQKKFEADYWPDKAMEQQSPREPSCRLSLKDKLGNTPVRCNGKNKKQNSKCWLSHAENFHICYHQGTN